MEPFVLRSDRAHLSVPTADDVDHITELCQDPTIPAWTTMPSPYARRHADEFVRLSVRRGWAEQTALTWAIRDPQNYHVVGMIGINLSGDGKGELGFWLGAPARGKGIMSHVVRMVASRVFADPGLGVTHLIWWAYVGNWASRRVAWATGFRHEGLVRGGQPQRGRRRDAWVATLRPGDPMVPASRWLDIPTIRGTRVTLRPFDESDANAVAEACSDPTTRRWLNGIPRPYTRDHARDFIEGTLEAAASGRSLTWAAASNQAGDPSLDNPGDGHALGAFTLTLKGPRRDQASVGYWVHPAARGQGVATEATRMMARHALIADDDGGLGLRRLVVSHAQGNDASRRVVERVGFQHSGVERGAHELPDAGFVDNHFYDLFAHELR